MEREIVASSFTFNEYVIRKSVFEINEDFQAVDQIELDFKLNTDIKLSESKDAALVILICEVFKDPVSNNYPFYIQVEIMGNFSLNGEVDANLVDLCKVNGTAILFPYLRAYVSYLTSMAGFPNLLLPTVNVSKMLEE